MLAKLRRFTSSGLLVLLLSACGPSSDDIHYRQSQKYYFLESMQQVELGGRRLRDQSLNQIELVRALAQLDEGLKLAFQVERKFLDELDIRLGKNFQRYFIGGVENYRIGIEAGDEAQQRKGLRQLATWSKFWNLEQANILASLNPD